MSKEKSCLINLPIFCKELKACYNKEITLVHNDRDIKVNKGLLINFWVVTVNIEEVENCKASLLLRY